MTCSWSLGWLTPRQNANPGPRGSAGPLLRPTPEAGPAHGTERNPRRAASGAGLRRLGPAGTRAGPLCAARGSPA